MKKKLLFVFALSLSLSAFLFLYGDKKAVENGLLSRGDSFIEGLKVVHKRDGKNIWTLIAQKADITENDNKAKMTGVAMTIEDKGMTIHARDGLYDMSNRNLTLYGDITADTKDYTIAADSCEWNPGGDIKTKGNVKIECKRFNIEGSGMEANSDQKVKILKNVKAVFYN